jgi:hypothetical protein
MILPTRKDAEILRSNIGKVNQSRGAGVHNSPGGIVTAGSFKRERRNDQFTGKSPLVKLTQTGGTGGDATHICSFTYSVFQLDGATALKDSSGTAYTVQAPIAFRSAYGLRTAATYGLWDFTNKVLAVAFEEDSTGGTCP